MYTNLLVALVLEEHLLKAPRLIGNRISNSQTELQHDSITPARFVPPSICGAFRSVEAQRLVGKKLIDHAVDSKAHCNTAIWSLRSSITLGCRHSGIP